jgi:hypothetical protein
MATRKLLTAAIAVAVLLSGTSAYAATAGSTKSATSATQKKMEKKAVKQSAVKTKRASSESARLTSMAKKLGIDPAGKTAAQLKAEIQQKLADLKAKRGAAKKAKATKKAAKAEKKKQ